MMRELIKYLITITVLAGGFYGALHFRRADTPASGNHVDVSPASSSSRAGPVQPQVCQAQRQAPLAALIDTERMMRAVPEEMAVPVVKGPPSIARQSAVEAPPELAASMPLNRNTASAKKPAKTDTAAPNQGASRLKASSHADSLPTDQQPEEHDDPFTSPSLEGTAGRVTEQPPPVTESCHSQLDPLDGPVAGVAKNGGAAPDAATAPIATASDGPPTSTPSQRIGHCIVEGDTLPDLAARYLGDRSRYGEIFQANRQILPDPRLLPIGEEIWIECPQPPKKRPAGAGKSEGKQPNRGKKHAELARPSQTLLAGRDRIPVPPFSSLGLR